MISKNNAPQLSNQWLNSFPNSPTKCFLSRGVALEWKQACCLTLFFSCAQFARVSGKFFINCCAGPPNDGRFFLSSCRHLTPPFPPYPLTLTPWPPKGKEEKLLFSYSSKGHTTRLSVVIRNRRYRLS